MLTRCFALSCLLLFCVLAQAQRTSTPGGTDSGHSSSPQSAAANSNASFGNSPVSISSADQEGKIKFRTQTILVQVPIVVTDKSGNHVHGLTKGDFQIFENGKEQKVATFEEIVTTNQQLPVAASKPGEFSNLTLSDQQPHNVTVIALDTINTPFTDQATGRQALVKYLADNLNSGQVMALMIITSHGVRVVQGLTGGPEQLVQVLKRASGEQPVVQGISRDETAELARGDVPQLPTVAPSANANPQAAINAFLAYGDVMTSQFVQERAIEETLNGFLGIAWSLSGVPGRKSLIWATGGFPFDISTPAQLPGGYLSPLYERTMQALDAAQISVYPVDVRGLVANSPTGSAVAHAGSTAATGRGTVAQISNRSWLLQSQILALDEFADMTGGMAFHDSNDLVTSFKRAADDASSYYLTGYYLDTHNNNAGWRKLKVKVDKKDTEVRAREGFFVTNASMNLDATRSSDLVYALSSPIEGTGVPLTVRWLGTSGDSAKKKTEFLIHMPADGVSMEGSNGQKQLNFDFAAAAYINNGKPGKAVITIGKAVNANVPESQMASLRANGIDMKNALELAPGQYVVRVVVRDNVTGKMGSVTAPLTVN